SETGEWVREKITYLGAADKRAMAYLYLPKGFARPLQVIDYRPGGSVYYGLTVPQEVEVVCAPFIRSGRAVLVTVIEGMSERRPPPDYVEPEPTTVAYRDMIVRNSIDQRRALDYLATRNDIDMQKIACFALSAGAFDLVNFACEPRIRSILLLS